VARKLFCELGPWAFQISLARLRAQRHIKNLCSRDVIARARGGDSLPVLVWAHKSCIRRKLGGEAWQQDNKAVNLAIAAREIDGVLIRPGETFSLWALVGSVTAKKGYLEGPFFKKDRLVTDIGGGMCQLAGVLHWLALHSPLEVAERHHHNGYDLYPEPDGLVPYGCSSSINYNHLDYRLRNGTDNTFQVRIWTDETHVFGELRTEKELPLRWEIEEIKSRFIRQGDGLYRENAIERRTLDALTGKLLTSEVIRDARAKVMYDEKYITCQIE